ncbi:MAG: Asp-tRNA(Asn)/Glu-tRNA(Gln) amidotransferase subunit GatC [Candidatus Heimdallarchaeota archaeon]
MSEKEEISKETLEYISKLALLDLSEAEKENLSKELSDILSYFAKLKELDTENVKPMTHPIKGLQNVFREDIPRESLSQEEALKNTKYKLKGFFKAPKILKE